MDIRLRISLIVGIVIYFISIFLLLKNKHLTLKYTLLWILGGILMLFIIIFPNTFLKLMNLIGIVTSLNGIFAIMIFLLMLILISLTAAISQLNNKIRTLSQKYALAEKRIQDLEKKNNDI